MKMGGPELVALMESGLGNHPVMVRYFEKVGRAMAEDGQILHDEVSGVRSPATARSEIQKIMADRNDVYYHADKPGHRERVDQVNKLFELASLEG